MTWGELLKFIESQNIPILPSIRAKNDFLNSTVMVYDQSEGEFYPCDVIEFTEGDDVLDDGSMFIVIKQED